MNANVSVGNSGFESTNLRFFKQLEVMQKESGRKDLHYMIEFPYVDIISILPI